jgi:hypothetical protein
MFLVILFIFLISNFIFEDLNVLATNAAEAAEEIGQLKSRSSVAFAARASAFST